MSQKDEYVEEWKKKKIEEFMQKKDYPKKPIKLTDQNFKETIGKYPLVIIDCWAAYCPSCRIMGPIIEDLAKKYQGKLVFGKLNTAKNRAIPMKFGINAIPTLLVFKDGKLVDKMVGLKPKRVLESELKKYL